MSKGVLVNRGTGRFFSGSGFPVVIHELTTRRSPLCLGHELRGSDRSIPVSLILISILILTLIPVVLCVYVMCVPCGAILGPTQNTNLVNTKRDKSRVMNKLEELKSSVQVVAECMEGVADPGSSEKLDPEKHLDWVSMHLAGYFVPV